MIILRGYQQELYDSIVTKFTQGVERILVQAETGWGKSILIGHLANNLVGRTLILTHRIELLTQNSEWINDLGVLTAKVKKPLPLKNNKNVIAMTQTASARFKKFGVGYVGDFDNIIVDETHVDYFKQVYDGMNYKKLIGLTATPVIYKNEKKTVGDTEFARKLSLADDFDCLLQGISASDLIDLGFLTEDRYVRLTPPNLDKLMKSANNPDGFTSKSMTEVFGSHATVKMVLKSYREYANNTKTIIFNPTTKVNKKIHEAFIKEGFGDKVKMYDSVNESDMSRDEIVAWYKATDDAILLNVGVFTTGFDVKDIKTIIYNKSTMSLSLWLQSCGRGSRIHKGKSHFTVIDLGLNTERHGFWSEERDWSKEFKIHSWKAKTPSDALDVWECDTCGAYNLRGTVYNEEKDQIECFDCGTPQPKRKTKANYIKGELEEIRVPRLPKADSILRYARANNNNANIAFQLLERKILELFWYHTTQKDYHSRQMKYANRVGQLVRPVYFAIIGARDLKGANRTLNKTIERIINKLNKKYNYDKKTRLVRT